MQNIPQRHYICSRTLSNRVIASAGILILLTRRPRSSLRSCSRSCTRRRVGGFRLSRSSTCSRRTGHTRPCFQRCARRKACKGIRQSRSNYSASTVESKQSERSAVLIMKYVKVYFGWKLQLSHLLGQSKTLQTPQPRAPLKRRKRKSRVRRRITRRSRSPIRRLARATRTSV